MRKIFFIFAMLLMSVTSILAENHSDFGLAADDNRWPPFEDEHFTVSGDWTDMDGMWIHNGCKINIKSNNGEIITKVVCTVTYGVEYVEDPKTHERIPTVNRAQVRPVFEDKDYLAAVNCATSEQRNILEAEAEKQRILLQKPEDRAHPFLYL